MPLFSVVIPTYNREAYVEATLQSVFDQECDDWELIVVDDGSTDATIEIVRRFQAHRPERVQILEQQHGGCAAARNRGANAASGEYLAFLDSDDIWFPWTLRLAADTLAAHGRPTLVGMTLRKFSDPSELERVEEREPELYVGKDFFTDALPAGFALGVAHTVCRRDAYLAVGGCAERDVNATDTDVLLRLGDRPGFVRIMDPPLLGYRRHDGAVTVNPVRGHGGMRMLIENELNGEYPGGPELRSQRLEHILIRVRAVSVRCVNSGRTDLGWDLYRRAFWWNVRSGRLRYLTMFPLLPLRVRLLGEWRGKSKEEQRSASQSAQTAAT